MARKPRSRWLAVMAALAAIALCAPAYAQKTEDERTRSVKGIVTDPAENPIENAVVQLKNTKTLQVKSFFTNPKGEYYFHGLDPNVDYEVLARHNGVNSKTRTVSTFDNRSELIYNFEIEIKN